MKTSTVVVIIFVSIVFLVFASVIGYIAYQIHLKTSLPIGAQCRIGVQCASGVCGGFLPLISGGTCEAAPGSIQIGQPCSSDDECVVGTSGSAKCAYVVTQTGSQKVCCASGADTCAICAKCYCTNIANGDPCIASASCTSGACTSSALSCTEVGTCVPDN